MHRLEDDIKTELGEVEWGDREWIDLAQDRNSWRAVVSETMKLGSIKCWEFLEQLRNR